MHAIQTFLARPETERLGWVLLHFVWQGALIGGLAGLALFALRRRSANLRYLMACAALLAMAVCLPATWLFVSQPATVEGAFVEAKTSATVVMVEQSAAAFAGASLRSSPGHPEFTRQAAAEPPAALPIATAVVPPATWREQIAVGLPWIVAAWIAGVFGLSVRLAIGWSAVHRLRRAASRPEEGAWQVILSQLCGRFEIRSAVKLLETALVDVPTMIGWLRPAILWPPALLAGLSVEQFEALLAHELAHVRRHDYLVNLLQTAIETLLFYHPAVWWLSRRIRHERECCCDDLAVAACGNRLSYARALAALEELRPRPRQLALAADGGRLLARIRRIVGLPAAHRRSAGRYWLVGISLVATLMALGISAGISSLATGDEPAKTPADSRAASNTPDAAREGLTIHDIASVLVVETREFYLDEKLADRIQAMPHVKSVVNGGLVRAFSYPEVEPNLVAFIGAVPGYSTQDYKLKSGRLLNAGDHKKVVISASVAEGLQKSVGDRIKFFGTVLEVVGIVEPQELHTTSLMEMPLSDMQDFEHCPGQVNSFLVGIDIPNDGSAEHNAQLEELRNRLRTLDEAIGVSPWPERIPIPHVLTEPPTALKRAQQLDQASAPGATPDVSMPLDFQMARVIDDETGKRITAYHVQRGNIQAKQGAEAIAWGPAEIWPDNRGHFRMRLDWYAGERARIVAGGYVPQEILFQPPRGGGPMIVGNVVRLKRGRQLAGHVVDHAGNPVANASVFVVGAFPQVKIGGGKALTLDEMREWSEDASIARCTTDAEGKFTVIGVCGDAKYLAVSCPALDLWLLSAPLASEPQTDFEIRLPEPGKLIVHFDISGADEARVVVRPVAAKLSPADGRGQASPAILSAPWNENEAGVLYGRNGIVKQRGELAFDNLPPADYVVERVKQFESSYGVVTTGVLGLSVVKIVSGKTVTVDFARPKGASVSGQVLGLDRPELRKVTPARVFVSVEKVGDREGEQAPNDVAQKTSLDVIDVGTIFMKGDAPEGKITTERLPPGQYRLTAQVFNDQRSSLVTLDTPPLFAGEALVTVPDDVPPPPVKIELHKYEVPAQDPLSTKPRAQNEPPTKPGPPSVELELPAPPAPLVKLKTESPRPPFDLDVMRIRNSGATGFLPDSLGDRIKKLPHVTAVWGCLGIDSPPGYGLPANSPAMKELKVIAGRMLANGDRHKVIVGKLMAEKTGLKVGSTTKIYGTDAEIVGVFDHPGAAQNYYTVALLPDLQELMHADRQISEFMVRVDIPQDGTPDHRAQMAELCKQIEEIGYDLRVIDIGQPRTADSTPPAQQPWPQERIQLYGRVVDDQTGKLIPAFHRQMGRIWTDQVEWNGEYGNEPPDPAGYFLVALDWKSDERVRIVANGYVPEVVLTERPKPDATEIKGITVRMKRGWQVSGRVLDHAGKPVAGASVFVVGSLRDVKITGGKAFVETDVAGPDPWVEDEASGRFPTDAEGRFSATGIGWDSRYLAVSCPALDLWLVRAPSASQPQTDFEIRLPQPGKLTVHYDIPGGAETAQVAIWPWKAKHYHGGATRWPSGPAEFGDDIQASLLYGRNGSIKQRGELVFDNLPPGDYVVERVKRFEEMRRAPLAVLDQTVVKIEPGKTTIVDFVSSKGVSITGQVIGLDRADVLKAIPSQVFVSVGGANEAEGWQPPNYDVPSPTFDVVAVASLDNHTPKPDGKFTTKRLPPGQYRLMAKVIDERPNNLSSFDKPPLFIGETLATIPAEGEPPPVKIELHKYEAPTKNPQPSKPATGTAAPQGGYSAKNDPKATQENPQTSAATADIRIDLIVQKVGTNDEIVRGPPEEIGDRIKQLPHVTAVARGAMDVVSPERDLQVEVINGWPTNNSPEMQDLARRFGRRIVPGDQDDRMLGAVVALKLRAKIGDTSKTFNADYAVLGVFESKTDILSEMAKFQKRPPVISAFVVSTDIPKDNWPEHQAPMNELCRRIEGLGDRIIVVRAKPAEEATGPASVPIEISGKVVDDATGRPITSYDKEGGRVDPNDPKKINWGAYLVRGAGDSEGHLSGSMDWYGGWRERIVARGYAPQEIRWEPLGPASTRIGGVIVRLKRMDDVPQQGPSPVRAGDSTSPAIGDSAKGHLDVARNEDQSGGGVRDIVAAVPGVVKKVHVQHGQLVEKGQQLLTIDNPDLKAQIEDVQGKLNTAHEEGYAVQRQLQNAARNNLSAEDKERLSGQALEHETMAGTLEKQLKILREKEKQLQVVSPIKGKIITWQIYEKLLKRPVDTGQVLLQVAVTDEPGEHDTSDGAQLSRKPERSTGQPSDATKNSVFDFVVQKAPHDGNLETTIPQDLVDRIRKIPHVADATAGLMDVVSFVERNLNQVFVVGVPADSPLLEGWKIKAGRRFEARDRRMVMLGTELATALEVKVGDKIKIYNAGVPIVGIFESGNRFENMSLAMRLSDLQEFMDRPHRITSVLVRTDVPKDDTPEHKAQLAEVQKQIESLDKEIAVVPANQASAESNGKPAEKSTATPAAAPNSHLDSGTPAGQGESKPNSALGQSKAATEDDSPQITGTVISSFEMMQSNAAAAHTPPSKPIEVSGQVIDDATNKPAKSFLLQHGQLHPNPSNLKHVVWSSSGVPGQADGHFKAMINWDAGERMRVVAAGYIPEPILVEPPKPGATKIEGIVIRLKHGRQVSGRVLDYLGKPVAGAGLFVIGDVPGATLIKGGKALVGSIAGWNGNKPIAGWNEDKSVVRFATDAEGRFTVDGVSEAAHMIAVSCPALELQIVEAPLASQPQKDFEIRLRQPGKLVVHYDIPGAPDEGHFQLTTEMKPGLSESQANSIENGAPTRFWYADIPIKQHGEWAIDSIPPGDYHIVRKKDIGPNRMDVAYLDNRMIRIVSGQTTTADFVRDTGARVHGQVVGLDRKELQATKAASVYVRVVKPGESKADWRSRHFDMVSIPIRTADGKPSDGSFTTERLPPGQYDLDAQLLFDADGKILREPLIGMASITVPENGDPSPVRIQLAKRSDIPVSAENEVGGNPWSKPVGGLQARLTFERAKETNGTPILATYLELRNVSDSATPIEVALDPSKIEFKVTDAAGKEVAQAGSPYDGVTAAPGTLRLPHNSEMRLSVAGNGAGVPKDQGGLLDVASSANWVFKRGDIGSYYLRAKITISKADGQLWSGTLEIPDTRIPLQTKL